jgi:DNA-binding MarR family transcriptional regulator
MSQVERRVGYLIKQAQQLFHRSCEERLRPLGLSMSQYAVLRALSDVPGAAAAELARRTFVTRQSLHDVLTGLQARALVNVATRPTTGRALPITLTDTGHSLLDQADDIVLDMDARMLADLTDEDTRRLASLLDSCIKNLT